MASFLKLLELSRWCCRLGTIKIGRRFRKEGRGDRKGVSRFENGFERKMTNCLKSFKMRLMQVWFANPMCVDEVLFVQNGTSVIMEVG
jgi:hypothetical protein